ncbi:MAG: alkaline phosphatase family protein [Pirellulaceae bacterium]|nr:alkaline phosphatase family protein [Pirellulaceae bacterium]
MVSLRVMLLPVICLLATSLRADEPRRDRCVILVSVDGLAGFYLDDPKAHLPNIRKLAAGGARASGMVCSFPTVTWPNHTTLVTGVTPARHGVIGNSYLNRGTGETVPLIPDPLLDKDQIVKVPTVYDVAHQAGLTTAAIVWPATRNARTLDFTVPDMKGNESWTRFGTASWLAELREAGLPIDRYGPWVDEASGGVQRDWLYVRMAEQLLDKHAPHLLLIHLVEVDHVQHRHGPRSGDAYWSVSYADSLIGDLLETIERSPRRERTTLIVASDHGFFPSEMELRPNVLLRQRGLLSDDAKLAICVPQGGGCAVYILDDERREAILRQLATEFGNVRGIQAVIPPERFAAIGQPTRQQNPQGADLWLAAESGFTFSGSQAGDEIAVPLASRGGSHGYLPDQPDMLGALVMHGSGVRKGAELGKVQNVDVAPTIARLLGVELPRPDGQVLAAGLSAD